MARCVQEVSRSHRHDEVAWWENGQQGNTHTTHAAQPTAAAVEQPVHVPEQHAAAPTGLQNTLTYHLLVPLVEEAHTYCPATTHKQQCRSLAHALRTGLCSFLSHLAEVWGPGALSPFLAALLRCALCEHAPPRGQLRLRLVDTWRGSWWVWQVMCRTRRGPMAKKETEGRGLALLTLLIFRTALSHYRNSY